MLKSLHDELLSCSIFILLKKIFLIIKACCERVTFSTFYLRFLLVFLSCFSSPSMCMRFVPTKGAYRGRLAIEGSLLLDKTPRNLPLVISRASSSPNWKDKSCSSLTRSRRANVVRLPNPWSMFISSWSKSLSHSGVSCFSPPKGSLGNSSKVIGGELRARKSVIPGICSGHKSGLDASSLSSENR